MNVLPDPGRFRWDVAAGTLAWSRSLFRLHGYEPGDVTPSPALALHHKHPDDFHGCVDAVHAGLLTTRLIVHEHRIVDRHQQARPALMIARGTPGERGPAAVLCGFLLPTDQDGAAGGPGRLAAGMAALVPFVMSMFALSEPAARVLLACADPHSPRSVQEFVLFHRCHRSGLGCCDLRPVVGDMLFPMGHLVGEPADLAA
jgi:hypothetical protein